MHVKTYLMVFSLKPYYQCNTQPHNLHTKPSMQKNVEFLGFNHVFVLASIFSQITTVNVHLSYALVFGVHLRWTIFSILCRNSKYFQTPSVLYGPYGFDSGLAKHLKELSPRVVELTIIRSRGRGRTGKNPATPESGALIGSVL